MIQWAYHMFFSPRIIYRIRRRVIRRHVRRKPVNRKDYLLQRESARALVMERLTHFVSEYTKLDPILAQTMAYKRVSIRNQRGRWGSCSSKKNLNFNYRVLTLAPELRDYIIVHELCHLKELHHGEAFWNLVERVIPDAQKLNTQARRMKLS